MAKATENVFAKFMANETKTATIKALDGAEIKYRTLTVKEADDFQKRSIKGFDDDGKPEFNFNEINEIRYEKLALCLIEPKMTVEDLKGLDSSATKALVEIEAIISGMGEDVLDEKGN